MAVAHSESSADVVIYADRYCPQCRRVRALLWEKGIDFEEVPIIIRSFRAVRDANFRTMVRKTGGRQTVPQVFIRGMCIGDAADLFSLEASGKLDSLLRIRKSA